MAHLDSHVKKESGHQVSDAAGRRWEMATKVFSDSWSTETNKTLFK